MSKNIKFIVWERGWETWEGNTESELKKQMKKLGVKGKLNLYTSCITEDLLQDILKLMNVL